MTRITRANHSHNAFAFNYLTGFTPAFDGRSDFHNRYNLQKKYLGELFRLLRTPDSAPLSSVFKVGMPTDVATHLRDGLHTNLIIYHPFPELQGKKKK